MAEKKKTPKVRANVKRVAARVRATSKKRGKGGVSRKDARAKARNIIATRPKASAKVRKVAAKVRKRRIAGGAEGVTRQDARAQARKILSKKVPGKVSKGNSDEGRKTRKRTHKR